MIAVHTEPGASTSRSRSVHLISELAHDDAAWLYCLPAENLDASRLGVRVSTVLGRARTLFVCIRDDQGTTGRLHLWRPDNREAQRHKGRTARRQERGVHDSGSPRRHSSRQAHYKPVAEAREALPQSSAADTCVRMRGHACSRTAELRRTASRASTINVLRSSCASCSSYNRPQARKDKSS